MAFTMTRIGAAATEAETARHVGFHGDAELARRAAGGDASAFSLLVARYQRPMAALVSRMARNSDDVDDIVQELLQQLDSEVSDSRKPSDARNVTIGPMRPIRPITHHPSRFTNHVSRITSPFFSTVAP